MTIEILCEAAGPGALSLSLSLVTHMSRRFGRKNGEICILLGRKRQTNKLRRAQVDCARGGRGHKSCPGSAFDMRKSAEAHLYYARCVYSLF
jgi:hypothetical protein